MPPAEEPTSCTPPAHCDPQPSNPSQPLTQAPKPPVASRCHYPSTPTPTLLPNVLHPKPASYPNPNPSPPSTSQVPAVAFFGDWRCPLFPRLDAECLSFVGPPLQLPQLPEPTPEQVAGWDDAMYYLSMPCTQCN